MADSSFGCWIRVAADFIPQLTRVSAAGYELQLTPSYGWHEFRWLDATYSWFILQLTMADSILQLTQVLAAGLEMRLTYSLIYQVNLRNYSAKYIIFCFLQHDFSYHWFRLWLLLQGSWSSLKKLEKAWIRFKTLATTDSSCSGWFKTCHQSSISRILTPMLPDRCTLCTTTTPCWTANVENLKVLSTYR